MNRLFDWSNQNGVLTLNIIRAAQTVGFTGIVINTYGATAVDEMRLAQQERLETAAYVYLNFPGGEFYSGVSARDQVTAALDKMDAAGVQGEWLGLDCEDPGNSLGVADTVAFIQEAADACVGRRYSRIYTARGWWKQYTGDSHAFSQFPLWLADPTGVEPTSLVLAAPLGGWTKAAMIQYSFHGHITGLPEVDLDAGLPAETSTEETLLNLAPLSFDATVKVAEATYAQFNDVAIDQHGGAVYEVTGTLPAVNGTPVVVPDGGEAYLVVLPRRA